MHSKWVVLLITVSDRCMLAITSSSLSTKVPLIAMSFEIEFNRQEMIRSRFLVFKTKAAFDFKKICFKLKESLSSKMRVFHAGVHHECDVKNTLLFIHYRPFMLCALPFAAHPTCIRVTEESIFGDERRFSAQDAAFAAIDV